MGRGKRCILEYPPEIQLKYEISYIETSIVKCYGIW